MADRCDPSLNKQWRKLMCNSFRLGLITKEEFKRFRRIGEVRAC